MMEPEQLAVEASSVFKIGSLDGVKIVITAGPTREAIDPVRYISNHSSGKMGFALAQAAMDAGASVTLITGPVSLQTPERVTRIDINSAAEMHQAVIETLPVCDIFIGSAAVADYRPTSIADQKIKKSTETMTIELVRNPDIIADVSNHPQRPFTIGFAAETQDVESYARGKLEKKKLDLIIANDVSNTAIGFNSDNNAVSVIWNDGKVSLPMTSKQQLGRHLIEEICQHYRKK
jgi:phosphopantothenoylcysteine decarboxylase/phosphopantothenate--cysteine ligase